VGDLRVGGNTTVKHTLKISCQVVDLIHVARDMIYCEDLAYKTERFRMPRKEGNFSTRRESEEAVRCI
jgi:hypothetical protein